MATQWGRKEQIIWQPHMPVYSYWGLAAAFLCALFFLWENYSFQQPAICRAYTSAYLRASFGAQLNQHGTYRLITLGGNGLRERVAVAADFDKGTTQLPDGTSIDTMLSETTRKQGYTFFHRAAAQHYADAALADWLRAFVFGGHSLVGAYAWPLAESAFVLCLALIYTVPKDQRRLRELKYGRRLKGPLMLDPKAFNREVGGDGIGITTDDPKTVLRIPREHEPQHLAIIGDTGTGKSTIIKQFLQQIQEREESAIVYDPACEFVQRFYDPHRGDIILNPLDARCPYWGPAEELRRKAEAKAIAASLYQPTSDKKGEFFTETPQKIFAHLLTFGPTPQQLVEWMSNPDEIDRRVQGTELAQIIAKGAQQQRSGVLASLGLIADSLRMLPTKAQTEGRTWSATQWAEKREGWIFITSQATEREALRPLHSLWIDLLVLRLLNAPTPEQRPVWFVLDELASLQRLPQLHTAITENRKSKNPLILGLQGKAQLETIYGHYAEVMLSQPASKIFARTTEPAAAKWISEAIGEVEIERMKETHQHGTRHGRSFSVDRQTEPLVMASEISGLADKHAFLKIGNNVARFSFAYTDLPAIAAAFEPRTVENDELSYDPITLKPRTVVANRCMPANTVLLADPENGPAPKPRKSRVKKPKAEQAPSTPSDSTSEESTAPDSTSQSSPVPEVVQAPIAVEVQSEPEPSASPADAVVLDVEPAVVAAATQPYNMPAEF